MKLLGPFVHVSLKPPQTPPGVYVAAGLVEVGQVGAVLAASVGKEILLDGAYARTIAGAPPPERIVPESAVVAILQ